MAGGRSAPQVFTTVFPEDGVYRYTLAIHTPSYCLTNNTRQGGACSFRGWDLSDFSFDGTLTVTTDNLQYISHNSQSYTNPQGPLILTSGRLNNRLSGQIRGNRDYGLPNPGPFVNGVAFSGGVAGDSDNAGSFKGTFDGSAEMLREGFPSVCDITCSTSGFTWTLTPR